MNITKLALPFFLFIIGSSVIHAQTPQITEFLAINDSDITDGNGDHSDWIEIHNPSGAPVDLAGWHITDDATDLTKYTFPAGSTIPANGYQIVFASKAEVPPANEWHTNFSLSSNGEYLGLVRPDGTTVVSEYGPTYPEQYPDISYGRDSGGTLKYFLTPTGGSANGSGTLGFVGDTTFSHKRGFYETAFLLTIDTTEPNSTIRYTTNGSEPDLSNGFTYNQSQPISITTTTTIRVRAYKTGFLETNVDTQTYLFPADIIDQNKDIPNYPRNNYDIGSGNGTVQHDYEMDPDIVTSNSVERAKMIEALKDIPTISLVTNRSGMFGNNGFYDDNGESRTSVEVIYPDSPDDSEQADGGVEGHSHDRLKRSLRLNFSKSLGDSHLKTNLFRSMSWNLRDENEHDSIILRAGNNRAWSRNWSGAKCSFAIDEMARQMQLSTSGYGMRGSYVHLYINGLYWGLYNPVERANDDYAERYFGGDKDDWTARNHGGAFGGASNQRYNYLKGDLKNKDMSNATNYSELQEYLDTDGFIEYLLIQWLNTTTDWPTNNWYAVNRNASSPEGSTPLRFLTWDSEWSWNLPRDGGSQRDPWVHPDFRSNKSKSQGGDIPRIFNSAKDNSDFIRRLGDLAYKHLMNDGSLSDAAMIARYTEITDRIRKAVLAESARWGDSLGGVTYTRDVHWENEVDNILDLMQGRASKLIEELRDEDYYPSIDPPTFNQRGGEVSSGFNVTLSNSNSSETIRYTLDGSDPADGNYLSYSNSNPINITEPVLIRTRAWSGSEWSAIDEATFFITGPPALVISEIMYNPPGANAYEALGGFTDGDEFEFIEIHNTSMDAVELEGIVFTDGIEFTFPSHTLAAGDRVVVAANPVAFDSRYRFSAATVFGGFTSGKLSNSGETIRLETALGELITEITYSDTAPWPEEADGEGFSLVYIGSPGSDVSSPSSWSNSPIVKGTPGYKALLNYAIWINENAPEATSSDQLHTADLDYDGIPNLVEYAFDLNPLSADADQLPQLVKDGEYFSVTYDIALSKDDILVEPQISEDLSNWSNPVNISTGDIPDSPAGFKRKKITIDGSRPMIMFRYQIIPKAPPIIGTGI